LDSLQITTGQKRLPITRDGESVGEIVFNPGDVIFAEKFYRLIGDFQRKLGEYQSRGEAIDAVTGQDEHGIPVNAQARFELMRDVCEWLRSEIDDLFGAGTSQVVFGDAMALDMFQDFFTGITPFIQKSRSARLEKYTNKRVRK
jgi:hypothetical protein